MRHLLVIVPLLCAGAVAAQTDSRRVRTVEIDDGAVAAAQSDERREAEHPDEHLILARQLVDLAADSDGQSESDASCVPPLETMRADIAAAYRASPRDFHGMTPRSPHWPDVERAWHDYYVDVCGAQSDESPAAIIARSYAANLSTDELREVIAFQESAAGRAFIAATRRARQELDSAPAPRAGRDTGEASATFRQAMQQLKAKYESAPK